MKMLKLEKSLHADACPLPPDAVVEVPVLLESRLLPLLASAADGQGMTAGTLVRCLIRDFLDSSRVALPAFTEPTLRAHNASAKRR